MVLISKRDAINRRITNTKRILGMLVAGVAFLLVSVLIVVIDPINLIINYELRLAKGSSSVNMLQQEIVGARLAVYMFNITNLERFLAGDDEKIRFEEVGPFVFQEYRWYEDMEFSEDGKQVAMTPRTRSEFIPERSIAHPKDVNLTLLNIPMISAVAVLASFPSFVQYTFNMLAAQLDVKPIITIDLQTYLYGYSNPLMTILNTIAPGYVYFEKMGIFDRLYDVESEYKVIVGATDEDRFRIKSVKRTRRIQSDTINQIYESELTFIDTYEGIGYPPMLTPELPLYLYRLGVCRNFKLEYVGRRTTQYGGDGMVYTLSNETFQAEGNSSTRFFDGLMDVSKCYYDVPFVVSKAHFLDADPRILELIDGLKPDRNIHFNEIVIDRTVSVPVATNLSIQLSMALDDLSFNRHSKKLSNKVLPITHIRLDQPEMPESIQTKFFLAFELGPKLMICILAVLSLTSLALIGHAGKLIYFNWTSNTKGMKFAINVDEKLLETERIDRS